MSKNSKYTNFQHYHQGNNNLPELVVSNVTYLMRIPVRVINNNSVSHLQIQPKTSCPGAQQEDKVGGVFSIEKVQEMTSII